MAALRSALAGVLAATALAASAGPPPEAATAPGLSPAERLVFTQPHLANVEAPRVLRYRYVRDGGGEARLEDDVAMSLTRSPDGGCCTVRGAYLTGERALALPDVDGARANPVVLYFLEQQVRELQRRTGGGANHFRQRIRLALANDATVSETTVRWNGREQPARMVRIAPYTDDPHRPKFERDALTEYRFVLADAVPGGVWELRASLPGAGAGVQTLTLLDAPGPVEPRR
jgi:hypothetical protein